MEFSAARGQEMSTEVGFEKRLDHFMSITKFLSLASKDNDKDILITGIRVQTSCFSWQMLRSSIG